MLHALQCVRLSEQTNPANMAGQKLRPDIILVGDDASVAEDCWYLANHRKLGLRSPQPCDVISANECQRSATYVRMYLRTRQEGSRLCSWDNLVFHTGDAPRYSRSSHGDGPECESASKKCWVTWSAVSNKIPTLRRSSGLILSASKDRQILMKELYIAHGFPALAMLCPPGVPVWDVFFHPFANYANARQALGNAQHVAQVGNPLVCLHCP